MAAYALPAHKKRRPQHCCQGREAKVFTSEEIDVITTRIGHAASAMQVRRLDIRSAVGADKLGPHRVPIALAKVPSPQQPAGFALNANRLGRIHMAPPSEALVEVLLAKPKPRSQLCSLCR